MSLHATADTSRDAFAIHKASGKLSAQQHVILAFLITHRDACTRSEIAEATGIRLSAVCGRVSELIALDVVEQTPRRICTVTGSSAHPVRLARKQATLF